VINRLRSLDSQLLFFIAGTVFYGISTGLSETSFNNYLSDTYQMGADERGRLEFPRELPGFLVAVMAGALFLFSELHIAILSMILMAIGLAGIGLYGQDYSIMMGAMVVWSIGMHLAMPVIRAISLNLAQEGRGGTMLGRLGGIRTGAAIIGGGLVWLGLGETEWEYLPIFIGAALACLLCAGAMMLMRPIAGHEGKRPKFVFRKKYWLFYLLNILFGARKQVFITFGPWVLVKVFCEPVSTIAELTVVASALGMFLSPQIGYLIDRLGERALLMIDALLLMAVCLGYGYAEYLPLSYAIGIIYVSFVMDQVLFVVGIARTTYLDKIAVKKDDLTASLSLGVTIDHAISMSIPTLGGLVWIYYGYQYVFIGAAGVALLTLMAASLIRVPPPESAQQVEVGAAGG
jgi:MFS family permease